MLKNFKQSFKKIMKIVKKNKIITSLSILGIAFLIYYFKPHKMIMENFAVRLSLETGLLQTQYNGYYDDNETSFFTDDNKSTITSFNEQSINITDVPENTSYEWVGYLTVEHPGNYVFKLISNDSSKLYINDMLVVDNGGTHTLKEKTGTMTLDESISYPIRLYYGNKTGEGSFTFEWKKPNESSFKKYLGDFTIKNKMEEYEKAVEIGKAEEAAEAETQEKALQLELDYKASEEENKKLQSELRVAQRDLKVAQKELTIVNEENDNLINQVSDTKKTKNMLIIIISIIGGLILLGGGIGGFLYNRNSQSDQLII